MTTTIGLNEQNPDRGIETAELISADSGRPGLNEQNPDRGIETGGGINARGYADWLE